MADKCFVKGRICTGKKKLDKLYLFLLFCSLDTIMMFLFLPELLEVPLGFICNMNITIIICPKLFNCVTDMDVTM